MSNAKQGIFLPPDQTRLVTICAHVDHGKTTLADNLVEANGIISERLAGTLRYLDSTEEEQRRGITMRASAIGLRHQYVGAAKRKPPPQGDAAPPSSSTPTIVHLLDSPGHTDFSMEVSSSLQCCDGCLLVVDAVEGMCARTHQVVREAHSHQLVPILVINKVDRLCTNLCLTPTEAYLRLRSLLESVNAACAAMLVSKRADDEQRGEGEEEGGDGQNQQSDGNHEFQDDDEVRRWTFEPHRGNVVFGSALYGWGFTIPSLARSLFRQKAVAIKPLLLKQYLFGDFSLKLGNSESDTKVLKWKASSSSSESQPPLFAEFGLQPLWDIYEGVAAAAAASGLGSNLFTDGRVGSGVGKSSDNQHSNSKVKIQASTPGMDQVLHALQVGNTASSSNNSDKHVLNSKDSLQEVLTRTGSSSSEDAALRSLLRRYRPLSDSVLDAVYEICPSPKEASETVRPRALALATPKIEKDDDNQLEAKNEFHRIQHAVRSCDVSPGAPVVAYVCKFMAADRKSIRDPILASDVQSGDDNDGNGPSSSSSVMLGLARVLSGRLKTGETYHVMGPKHRFQFAGTSPKSRPIRLYLIMGSSFVLVDEVPAGHLCAIQNLDDVPYKTATLCVSPHGMPLLGFADDGNRPLVKVNVEAVNPADTPSLERGLIKLSLADAAVEVTATAKGERILACLGELHLEASISDLQKVYCDRKGIELRISEPIVEFGETTEWFGDTEKHDFEGFLSDGNKQSPPLRQLKIPPYNEEEGIEHTDRGRARSIISGRLGAISLRVVPLDPLIYQSLKQGKMVEGSYDSLETMQKALGFSKDFSRDLVLQTLVDSLIAVDDGGNAIVTSAALDDGKTAAGILSERGQVYVPKKVEPGGDSDGVNQQNDQNDEECGIFDYQKVQREIRARGFGTGDVEPHEFSLQNRAALDVWKSQMKRAVVAGFQMAMRDGPVCEEPVRSVLVVLEGVEVALKQSADPENGFKPATPLSGGMVAACLRIGIRSALLYVFFVLYSVPRFQPMNDCFLRFASTLITYRSRPVRLVESHLKLTLHSSLAGLGSLYSVLSKRRGKVLDDSMVDGTDLLQITASIPHAESFGLAPELFRQSSGEVTAPELIFSHWERLDQDPFWIPTSLEEREDFGEILVSGDVSTGLDNTALKYIRKVRERKGLLVDSNRTVVAAEKQRTIKR